MISNGYKIGVIPADWFFYDAILIFLEGQLLTLPILQKPWLIARFCLGKEL